MEKEYTCPNCGIKGVRSSLTKPNFKCTNCGFTQNWFWRRELMDLSDPVEGELALEIFAGACGLKKLKKNAE
jgi:transposase